MERLQNVIQLLPELCTAGLLDQSGGSIGIRSEKGLFISPTGAGIELGWELRTEDFVMFPGGGEASMATAGRRPHRLNRLHRRVLGEFKGWNYTMEVVLPGLLAIALAGAELELNSYQAAMFRTQRSLTIRSSSYLTDSEPDPEDSVIELIRESFASAKFGAVFLSGVGLVAGADDLKRLKSRVLILDKLAQAQLWQLPR